MQSLPDTIVPSWPGTTGVGSLVTTRVFGDVKAAAVRERLGAMLPSDPVWLRQVHGTAVVDAAAVSPGVTPEADASFSRDPGVVCAVMAGDCMPVLLAARDGSVVAAAHAGWRGLCAGVIERAIEAMGVPGPEVLAYLGPAIGPRAYEVGDEVRAAFLAADGAAAGAFAGVGLTGVLAGGTDLAPILGTAGTVLGSVVCALAGRYLLLPVWVATRRVSARAQDAGTPKH